MHPRRTLRLGLVGALLGLALSSAASLAAIEDAARPTFDRAVALYDGAFQVRAGLLGPDDPATLSTLSSLADTLREQGEIDDARYLFELGHEIRAETLGSDHPDTLTALDEVAITLVYQGDSDGARDLFEQVIEGRTRTLGAEHPDTIRAKDNLAILTSALETAEPTPAD